MNRLSITNISTHPSKPAYFITVAPECKKNQRIIYGAAFKSEVMVNCYVEANPMPHSFKWQFKTASKRRRTDLINTVRGAKALDDIKDMVDLPANQYSLEYDHSLLRYRTMTEADYGFLYCWAENMAGYQREPCRYGIEHNNRYYIILPIDGALFTYQTFYFIYFVNLLELRQFKDDSVQ